MNYIAASPPSVGRLASTAICSASALFSDVLVSASESTSVFVPPDLRPLWMRPARVASRTIEILPFAVAAAVQDITRGFCPRTASLPPREHLGARLRREELSLPVPTYPGKMDEV